MQKKDIEIYVATHKQIDLRLPDCYRIIQVNAEKNGQWKECLHDNDGENISSKNSSYCELTALYQMWKNSKAEIQGLCHYRRYIGRIENVPYYTAFLERANKKNLYGKTLSAEKIQSILKEYDVILPIPANPYPKTVLEDLRKYVYDTDIDIMKEILQEEDMEAYLYLEEILSTKHISYCNMFITNKEIVNNYCNWLFDILAKIEKKIPIESYDSNHQRVMGYLSEVLLNVYMKKNKYKIKLNPMILLEQNMNRYCIIRMRDIINGILGKFGIYLSTRVKIWKQCEKDMAK